MKKYVKLIALGASVIALGLYCGIINNSVSAEVDTVSIKDVNVFAQVLEDHNVIVNGESTYVTQFQLQGMVDGMVNSDESSIQKFAQKIVEGDDKVESSAIDILEWSYYSSSKEEQMELLRDISNKIVDISSDGKGTMLISYN